MQEIKKPIQRSLLRSKLGKEYYILKRKLKWYFGKEKFSLTEYENVTLITIPVGNMLMLISTDSQIKYDNE